MQDIASVSSGNELSFLYQLRGATSSNKVAAVVVSEGSLRKTNLSIFTLSE